MDPAEEISRLNRELALERRARERLLKLLRHCDNESLIRRSKSAAHDELVATKRMLNRTRALNRALYAETVVLSYRLGEPVRIGKDLLVRDRSLLK